MVLVRFVKTCQENLNDKEFGKEFCQLKKTTMTSVLDCQDIAIVALNKSDHQICFSLDMSFDRYVFL